MTTLLDQGIQAVRDLPPERQDMAGELLLRLAATAPQYELTAEQIEDLKLAIAQADRGEFASDQEVADTWKKFGREAAVYAASALASRCRSSWGYLIPSHIMRARAVSP